LRVLRHPLKVAQMASQPRRLPLRPLRQLKEKKERKDNNKERNPRKPRRQQHPLLLPSLPLVPLPKEARNNNSLTLREEAHHRLGVSPVEPPLKEAKLEVEVEVVEARPEGVKEVKGLAEARAAAGVGGETARAVARAMKGALLPPLRRKDAPSGST